MTTKKLIDKLKRYVNSGILYSLLPEEVINEVIEKLEKYDKIKRSKP